MSTQRPRLRRRTLLALAAGTAGCTALGDSRPTVSVLAAGSLQTTLRDLSADGVNVRGEAMGSAAATRLVADGRRDPDVLAVADTALLDGLGTWYARFATNALTVAHTGAAAGRRVGTARRWFEPLLTGGARLGRTDPDLDPLGYRTLFMTDLAAAHHDRPMLRERLLGPGQVYPETGLLSALETGAVDAAVVYRSMAVDRGYPSVDLPAAVDLSDPGREYGRVSYTLPDGTTVRGAPIEYGATMRRDAPPVRRVFGRLVGGDPLRAHGFTIPRRYPQYVGSTPDGLA